MKKGILSIFWIFACVSAHAAPSTGFSFYECRGLGEVEEYRLGVNLQTQKAAFFDGDTVSVLEQTLVTVRETEPRYVLTEYQGSDAGAPGILKVEFKKITATRQGSAKLYTKKSDRSSWRLMGETDDCSVTTPWPELD